MDEKKFNKGKYIIVILLMVICLAVGCIIGKILLSGKNACLENAVIDEVDYKDDSECIYDQVKDEAKENNEKIEYDINDKENNNTDDEQNNNTKYWNYDNTDKMVDTMLSMIKGDCSNKNNFFITSNTNFENMPNEIKAEIALFNISDRYSNKLEDKIERTFGKNKRFDLPKKLNAKSWFVNYELVDGDYKEVADGGGCTEFGDSLKTAVIEKKFSENKITFKVNIGYLVRDNAPENGENIDIDEELHSTFYNGYDKTRVIERNIYHKNEKEISNKLLYTDKLDYILFTFIKEDEVYIFDKVELIKR